MNFLRKLYLSLCNEINNVCLYVNERFENQLLYNLHTTQNQPDLSTGEMKLFHFQSFRL